MDDLRAFLAGDRPNDVVLFLSESFVEDTGALEGFGERIESDDFGGVLLVVDGERGRSVFERMTGMDAMSFAGAAMDNPGTIDPELTGGDCPEAASGPQDHHAEFVFAFAEAQNDEVGGIYAEGDVIHAYVYCSCGTAYSDKWVAGEREK